MPASGVTVALYLKHVADEASSFPVVKSTSAAITYYQKINLYHHHPTVSHRVSFVRNAVMRRLALAPRSRKNPSQWETIQHLAYTRLGSEQPLLLPTGSDGDNVRDLLGGKWLFNTVRAARSLSRPRVAPDVAGVCATTFVCPNWFCSKHHCFPRLRKVPVSSFSGMYIS